MMSDDIQINENCTKQQQDTAANQHNYFFIIKLFHSI